MATISELDRHLMDIHDICKRRQNRRRIATCIVYERKQSPAAIIYTLGDAYIEPFRLDNDLNGWDKILMLELWDLYHNFFLIFLDFMSYSSIKSG